MFYRTLELGWNEQGDDMKRYFWVLAVTLLTASGVTGQTVANNGVTRQMTLQKGKVLRKNNPDKNGSNHAAKGTKALTLQKSGDIPGSSRNQSMVTKPLIPPQP